MSCSGNGYRAARNSRWNGTVCLESMLDISGFDRINVDSFNNYKYVYIALHVEVTIGTMEARTPVLGGITVDISDKLCLLQPVRRHDKLPPSSLDFQGKINSFNF